MAEAEFNVVKTVQDPFAIENRLSQRDVYSGQILQRLIGENAVGTLNIQDAAITNAKIANLSWDKGYGGSLTLGGLNNVAGILNVNSSVNAKRVVVDNSGVTIIGANGGGYYFKDTEAGAVQGTLTYDSTFGVYLTTATNKLASLYSDGDYSCGSLSHQAEIVGQINMQAKSNTGWARLIAATGDMLAYGYTTADVQAATGAAQLRGYTTAKVLADTGDAILQSTASNANVVATAGEVHLNTLTAGKKILLQSGGNIDLLIGTGYELTTDTDHFYFRNAKILTMLGSMSVPASGTTLTINGSSKTAIVPTKDGYNALYTNESPQVWFMDTCESKDKVDPLFLETIEEIDHFVKCEDINGKVKYQVWGIRKGYKDVRFESKTKEQFDKNNQFWDTPNR